jgi:hypothetical protein
LDKAFLPNCLTPADVYKELVIDFIPFDLNEQAAIYILLTSTSRNLTDINDKTKSKRINKFDWMTNTPVTVNGVETDPKNFFEVGQTYIVLGKRM